ncbi:MAG: S-adenosylmethionine uptake transporter [Hyphomicrobiaceae bacterium]|jgi:S-adenosylmethionine uptake transporter
MSEVDARAKPAPDVTSKASANLRAMGLIVIAMGAFVCSDTLMKATSDELPLGQMLALRGVMSCLIMLPIVAFSSGLAVLFKIYSWPVFIRNVAEIGAAFTFMSALFRLPMASVSGVLQAVPLTITAAAAIILREPVGWRRWTASGVGFLGVLLIIQPGTTEFSIWYLVAIGTVLCVTARDLATRYIAKAAPSLAITFITAIVTMFAGAALALTETLVVPSTPAMMQLAGTSAFVLVGYYSLIEAMRTGEISAVAPFRYSVVLWAMIMGYLVFNEVPSTGTIVGSMIVISAGLYTLHRERVAVRRG